MKTILIIFTIYLLVLPGIACAGENICIEPQNTAAQTAGHSNHEEEDGCGSFCTCSCCVHIVSVNFQQAAYIKVPVLNFQSFKSLYKDEFQSYNLHSIWQPLRLG